MEKTCTLRELIDSKVARSYFGTGLERIEIAQAFMDAGDALFRSKKDKSVIAFLTPENITVRYDDESAEPEYTFAWPEMLPSKVLKETPYENFAYAPWDILNFCDTEDKRGNSENIMDRFKDEHKIYTLSVLLFYIIFACHPYKNAEYYEAAVMTSEDEYCYFVRKPAFVFDPLCAADNQVETFHQAPNAFWVKLSDSQRRFFEYAFQGDSRNRNFCQNFFEGWKKSFGHTKVCLRAICGEPIPAMLFGNDSVLIATDVAIWESAARCYYCNKEAKAKCKACADAATAVVEICFTDAKITSTNAALGRKATRSLEKIISLSVGFTLTGKDLDPANGGRDKVFAVIPTKRRGILGIEYFGERPIYVETADGAGSIITQKAPRCLLLPGSKLYVSDTVTIEIMGKSVPQQK